jgi:hypothetical protein
MDTKPTDMGMNRTGAAMSPEDSREMRANEDWGLNVPPGDESGAADVRKDYARKASPLGTIPPPGSFKGAADTVMQALTGRKAGVLLDKVGERIAFERAGVRLYEGLIAKFEADDTGFPAGTLDRLREIQGEELEHFRILWHAMESLGGDPTAVTPSADATGVIGTGPLQLIADPRSTFVQGLEAIQVMELADNAAWETLVSLSDQLGRGELAGRFREAQRQEEEHVRTVKAWISESIRKEASAAG